MLLPCFKTDVGCYGGRPYCTVHILGRSSSQSRCVYSIFSLLRLRSALSTLLELMRSVLSMNRGYAFDLYDLRRDPSQREGWESDIVIYHRGETYIDLPMKMEEEASVLRRYQRARGQVDVIDHNQPLSC
jgi:hypothetical protein